MSSGNTKESSARSRRDAGGRRIRGVRSPSEEGLKEQEIYKGGTSAAPKTVRLTS